MFLLVPAASCAGTGYHWREPGSVPSAASLQVLTDIDGLLLSFSSSLSLSSQQSCSSPSRILVAFHRSHCSVPRSVSDWGAQHGPSAAAAASPELSRADHLSGAAGDTVPNAAQASICLLCSQVSLQLPVKLVCGRTPGAFPGAGLAPPQVQHSALLLGEAHQVPTSPFLRPGLVPLGGVPLATQPLPRFWVIPALIEAALPHHPDRS